jgi:hypothetical protein
MHEIVSAAVGMSLVDYDVHDVPVLDVVGGPSDTVEPSLPSRAGRSERLR